MNLEARKKDLGTKRVLAAALECQRVDKALVEKMVSEKKARPVKDSERVLRFVASTEKVDRDGDILLQNWDLDGFKKNPAILWNHDQDKPLGRAIREEIIDDKEDEHFKQFGKHLAIWVEFMGPEHGAHVEPIYLGFRDGFLKGGSVGYVPMELDEVYDEDRRKQLGLGPAGVLFKRCELAEFTLCTVPANRDALVTQMKSMPDPLRKALEPLLLAAAKMEKACTAESLAKACGCGKPEGCADPKELKAATEVATPKEVIHKVPSTPPPSAPAAEEKSASEATVTFRAANEQGLDDLEDDVMDLCSDLETFADVEVSSAGGVVVTFRDATADESPSDGADMLADRLNAGDLAGYTVTEVKVSETADEAGAKPDGKQENAEPVADSSTDEPDVTAEVAECVENLEDMVDELAGVSGAEEIAARMKDELEGIEELLGIDDDEAAESADDSTPTVSDDDQPARPPLESNAAKPSNKYARLLEDVARNLKS